MNKKKRVAQKLPVVPAQVDAPSRGVSLYNKARSRSSRRLYKVEFVKISKHFLLSTRKNQSWLLYNRCGSHFFSLTNFPYFSSMFCSFPAFFKVLTFPLTAKFPDFSLTAKCSLVFPVQVGTMLFVVEMFIFLKPTSTKRKLGASKLTM